jgi:hypothetical protein
MEVAMIDPDLWNYEQDLLDVVSDIDGFAVAARDGTIGRVAGTGGDTGSSFVVVDTGPWILGKRVLLPAGLIEAVDLAKGVVYINGMRDEVEHAPELPGRSVDEPGYMEDLAAYYGSAPLF